MLGTRAVPKPRRQRGARWTSAGLKAKREAKCQGELRDRLLCAIFQNVQVMRMNRRHRLVIGIAICLLAYVVAYPVVRWRNCLVMREYFVLKMPYIYTSDPANHVIRREVGSGWDLRTNWQGRLKNTLNPILFQFFRPCVFIESRIRGGDFEYEKSNGITGANNRQR